MTSTHRGLLAVVLVGALVGVGLFTGQRPRPTVVVWGSSSAARMADQAGLTRILGAEVVDHAVGGETAAVTAARQGGAPARLEVVGGTIPGSGDVPVRNHAFAFDGPMKIVGTLSGVHGALRSDRKGGFTFTRDRRGEPVPSPGITDFLSAESVAPDGTITLLWMGKNDLKRADWTTPSACTAAAWARARSRSDRVLVLGHFTDAWMKPGGRARLAFDRLEQDYRDRYGTDFVDVQAYLMSPRIWTDLRLDPTPADLEAQRLGVLPPALDDGSHGHLTTAAYAAVATHLVRPALIRRGWIA